MTNELTKIQLKTVPDLTGATEVMLQIRKQDESGLSVPIKPYLEWLAQMSCGTKFRNVSAQDNRSHLAPIVSDLARVAEMVFGYVFMDNHTDYQIQEMAQTIHESYPSLFYNHRPKGKAFEDGEVYAAFKLAYSGKLGLAGEDAKVYGNGDRINLNKIARVLDAYMKYRSPALIAIEDARHNEEKLLIENSEATKEAKEKRNKELVDMQLEELKAKKISNPSDLQIPYYDFFTKHGLMNPTNEDKAKAWQKACDVRVCNAHLKAINCMIPEIRDHYASVINDAGEPNFEVKDKALRRLQNDYINTVVLAQKIIVWEFVTGRDVMTLPEPYCRLNFRLSTEYLNSKY